MKMITSHKRRPSIAHYIARVTMIGFILFQFCAQPAQAQSPSTTFSSSPTFAPSLLTMAFDPCLNLTDGNGNTLRQDQQVKDAAAVKQAVEESAFAIDVPKHVKEIVTCLKDLMNIGLTIGMTFGWPNLNAIFTSLINQACQMLMSYMNDLISQLIANIQLPDVMGDFLGQLGIASPGFSLTGQFKMGQPAGSVTINTNVNGNSSTTVNP
jgi:hypothetical protein